MDVRQYPRRTFGVMKMKVKGLKKNTFMMMLY